MRGANRRRVSSSIINMGPNPRRVEAEYKAVVKKYEKRVIEIKEKLDNVAELFDEQFKGERDKVQRALDSAKVMYAENDLILSSNKTKQNVINDGLVNLELEIQRSNKEIDNKRDEVDSLREIYIKKNKEVSIRDMEVSKLLKEVEKDKIESRRLHDETLSENRQASKIRVKAEEDGAYNEKMRIELEFKKEKLSSDEYELSKSIEYTRDYSNTLNGQRDAITVREGELSLAFDKVADKDNELKAISNSQEEQSISIRAREIKVREDEARVQDTIAHAEKIIEAAEVVKREVNA